MFDENGLGNYGTDAARTRQAGDGSEEIDEKDQEIAHCRIVTRNRKVVESRKLALRHGHGMPGVRVPPSPPEYPRVFEVERDFTVQSERRSPANRRARIACRRASVRGRPASRTCVRRGRELR